MTKAATPKWFTIMAVGALVSCASASHGALDPVWDAPLRHDGNVYDLSIYPYDLLGDRNRYIMCVDPCSAAEAQRFQAVVVPAVEGAFEGMQGATAVRVRVEFVADCFYPDALCLLDHRPFVFRQVAAMSTADLRQ